MEDFEMILCGVNQQNVVNTLKSAFLPESNSRNVTNTLKTFPDILVLDINRLYYCKTKRRVVKSLKQFSFDLEMDLSQFIKQYSSEND